MSGGEHTIYLVNWHIGEVLEKKHSACSGSGYFLATVNHFCLISLVECKSYQHVYLGKSGFPALQHCTTHSINIPKVQVNYTLKTTSYNLNVSAHSLTLTWFYHKLAYYPSPSWTRKKLLMIVRKLQTVQLCDRFLFKKLWLWEELVCSIFKLILCSSSGECLAKHPEHQPAINVLKMGRSSRLKGREQTSSSRSHHFFLSHSCTRKSLYYYKLPIYTMQSFKFHNNKRFPWFSWKEWAVPSHTSARSKGKRAKLCLAPMAILSQVTHLWIVRCSECIRRRNWTGCSV